MESTPNRFSLGILDSGLGGLYSVRALTDAYPHVTCILLCDTAHLPLGGRPRADLVRIGMQGVRQLLDAGAERILLGCNTLSSVLEDMESNTPVPLFGVVKSSAWRASQMTQTGHIALIGTRFTINSGAYAHALYQLNPALELHALATPALVPFVEARGEQLAECMSYITDMLQSVLLPEVDTLILGCTHYHALLPFLQKAFPHMNIVDSTDGFLEHAKELFTEDELCPEQAHPILCFTGEYSVKKIRLTLPYAHVTPVEAIGGASCFLLS